MTSVPSPTRSAGPAPPGAVVQLFALAAGPFGWILQLSADYGLSSYACMPRGAPKTEPPPTGEHGVLLAINLACLLLALAGFAISLNEWRKLRADQGAPVEGRRRFLAGCGLLAASIFAAAILFNTPSALALRLCWGGPR
jgi:hypothetical protein